VSVSVSRDISDSKDHFLGCHLKLTGEQRPSCAEMKRILLPVASKRAIDTRQCLTELKGQVIRYEGSELERVQERYQVGLPSSLPEKVNHFTQDSHTPRQQ
jgi:hypothetical protein